VSFSGETSVGKTTALRLAASVWGCPDEGSRAAAIFTWDATRVWIERALAILRAVPLIIDDTKRALNPQDVAQIIYDVASSCGRRRGSPLGTSGSGTWRTLMITSGESPLTSFSEDGGTRARVIDLWGSPFQVTNADTARIVNRLSQQVGSDYGHAGPRFVEFLLRNQPRWLLWREQYEQLRRQFQERAGSNSIASRLGSHCAALQMAEILSHEASIVPWRCQDVVANLWGDLVVETQDADRPTAALLELVGWAHAHREEFHDVRAQGILPPSGGWAGRWHHSTSEADSTCLCVLVPVLNRVLREARYEPSSIRRAWQDRGWLRVNARRRTLRVRLCGSGDSNFADCVAVRWSAINDRLGPIEERDGTNRFRSGQVAP
jgi:putative DNA primase/helicase